MRPSPNTLPARMRRPPSAVSMAMATRRKIRAVTGPSVAPKNSIVPFHLHADLAIGIGADVALELGVLENFPLDHAAAGIGRGPLARADIDAGRHIAAALDRGRGALIAARTAGVRVDRQVVEA